MSETAVNEDFERWLASPPGRYLVAWEQAQLDRIVADLFGFHAVQLGVPALRALRANRMPYRWLALDAGEVASMSIEHPSEAMSDSLGADHEHDARRSRVDLHCDFDALPFKSQSMDLVVLPHALEQARDPHQTLREVERVLVPDGRVVITGFNSASLWGAKQMMGRWRQQLGGTGPLFLPRAGEFIGYRRLRDWLRLLSVEIEGGRFGCYVPAVRSEAWLQRCAWMEKTGDRWWPMLGAVYVIVAVKRVRGMRMVGLAKRMAPSPGSAPAVATHRAPRIISGEVSTTRDRVSQSRIQEVSIDE